MTGSSGIHVYTTIEDRACDECESESTVDVNVDPETNSTFWTCPNGHYNESTTWDDYEDEDPDAAQDRRMEDG